MTKEQRAKIRNEMREAGLCVKCGKPNTETRWATCPDCREKGRTYSRGYICAKYTAEHSAVKPASATPKKSKTAKCVGCEWAQYVGTGFFCPLPVGMCMKKEGE